MASNKHLFESSRVEESQSESDGSEELEDLQLSYILEKSLCEKEFGGELDVTEEPDTSRRSEARGHKQGFQRTMEKESLLLYKLETILRKMEDFCGTKRNFHKPITTGLDDAFDVLEKIRSNQRSVQGWFDSYE